MWVFGSTTTFIASYTNLAWSGIARPAIQSSHLGTTGFHTFVIGDLCDPGTVKVDLWWNPGLFPPVRGASETVTLKFAGTIIVVT